MTAQITRLRDDLAAVRDAALAAVRPGPLVADRVAVVAGELLLDGRPLDPPVAVGRGRIMVVGGGKAAAGIVPWAAADVAGALIEAAKKWEAGDDAEKAARNLADVKFQYEEDVNPELFFVPYIQSLIASYTPDLGGPTADLYVKPAKAATA